jgi:hypothetical protein
MDIFCEIPCLTERSAMLNGSVLQKKWFKSADKRILGQYLHKFIAYNSELLNFLGVQADIVGTDQNASMAFRTSSFIGTIPLRSSDTGKQIGDFIVSPRFVGKDRFQDYIEILDLLDDDISPEVVDSMPLISGSNFRPPFYLEALKFISSLEEVLKRPWRKFDNVNINPDSPVGSVNWSKFIANQYKVEDVPRFPTRMNILSELHSEFAEIRYVFDTCKMELLSSRTPQRIRQRLRSRLAFLDEKLYRHVPKQSNYIGIRASDSISVKHCKDQANRILGRKLADSTAWRVDFNDVFEKFVQHILRQVGKEVGGKLYPNHRIPSKGGQRFTWELRHLEPDAIYQSEHLLIFIDAKYKSNLYNKFSGSEYVKDEHRHDLHQILAYTGFSRTERKYGMLCYPSNVLELKSTTFRNNINETNNVVLILGLPLTTAVIRDATHLLADKFNSIKREESAFDV